MQAPRGKISTRHVRLLPLPAEPAKHNLSDVGKVCYLTPFGESFFSGILSATISFTASKSVKSSG